MVSNDVGDTRSTQRSSRTLGVARRGTCGGRVISSGWRTLPTRQRAARAVAIFVVNRSHGSSGQTGIAAAEATGRHQLRRHGRGLNGTAFCRFRLLAGAVPVGFGGRRGARCWSRPGRRVSSRSTLFGSVARRTGAAPTSDIDLVLVADGLPRGLADRRSRHAPRVRGSCALNAPSASLLSSRPGLTTSRRCSDENNALSGFAQRSTASPRSRRNGC